MLKLFKTAAITFFLTVVSISNIYTQSVDLTKAEKKIQATQKSDVDNSIDGRVIVFDPQDYNKIVSAKDDKKQPVETRKPQAPLGWQIIKYEDFEGSFPNDWNIYVNSGSYADAYWDDTSFRSYAGDWSCWCADLGSDCGGYGGQYVNNMWTWMKYGPFDLFDASDAEVIFYHWTKTIADNDKFYYGASIDDFSYYCWNFTGDHTGDSGNENGWLREVFDLKNVNQLGDLTGQSQVWISFIFVTDGANVDDGTYIDEVTIKKETASSITITQPNGGESWEAGSTQTITWNSVNTSGNVYLECHVFNNTSIDVYYIANSTEDDGSFDWTIPGSINSSSCKIYIRDVADGNVRDVSDDYFTISAPPSIIVNSPNGGETWTAGGTHEITWSSVNTSGNVYLECHVFNNATIDIYYIANSTEDDGSYYWTIPGSINSPSCKIYIRDVDNTDVRDMSDDYFTIAPPSSDPLLSVDPTTLDFGTSTTSLTFDIENIGSGDLNWNVSDSESWITVAPSNGTNDGTVIVTVNRDGLSPGNYSSTVSITSNGGDIDVMVNMIVAEVSDFWAAQQSGTIGRLYYVDAVSQNVSWVAGGNQMVLRTTDGGASWSNVWNSDDVATYCVTGLNGSSAFAATYKNNIAHIYKTENGGGSWTKVYEKASIFINHITMFDQNKGIAFGTPSDGKWTVLKTTNAGDTWHPMPGAPAGENDDAVARTAVIWLNEQEGWFGIFNRPKAFHTTNSGTSWTEVSCSPLPHVRTIEFNRNLPGTGLAAADYDLARTTDNGANWQTITPPAPGLILHITYHQGVFWMLIEKEIYKSTDNGTTWEQQYTADNSLNHCDFTTGVQGTHGWAVGVNGTILKYTDSSKPVMYRFQVDISAEMQHVNPGEIIGIRGSVSPLSWNNTVPMSDVNSDNIYITDVDFSAIPAGTKLEYKYVHDLPPLNDMDNIVWEEKPGENAPNYNRELYLTETSQVLPVVYWNNEQATNPSLAVEPTTLEFGSSLTSLTFGISNGGTGDLNWSVSENETWITSVSPSSGTNDGTVTVTVNRDGLSPGDYTGEVSVTSNGGEANVTATIAKALTAALRAVRFVAAGDYVEVPHSSSIAPSQFTIEFWLRVNGLGDPQLAGGEQTIIDKRGENNSGYNFRLAGTAFPLDFFGIASNGDVNTGGIYQDTWYHIAVTQDNNYLKLFIDGEQRHSVANVYNSNTDVMLRIGEFGGYPGAYLGLRGDIDDMRIWNYARSQSDIQTVMYEKLSGQESGLAAYWTFDSESGGIIPDLTANGNNAVMHGNATLFELDYFVSKEDNNSEALPNGFTLWQNYPNPFNPTTTISYALSQPGNVKLIVHNLSGQRVKQLVGGNKSPGLYHHVWDATDDNGRKVVSGVYIYTIQAGKFQQSRKMILLR